MNCNTGCENESQAYDMNCRKGDYRPLRMKDKQRGKKAECSQDKEDSHSAADGGLTERTISIVRSTLDPTIPKLTDMVKRSDSVHLASSRRTAPLTVTRKAVKRSEN